MSSLEPEQAYIYNHITHVIPIMKYILQKYSTVFALRKQQLYSKHSSERATD